MVKIAFASTSDERGIVGDLRYAQGTYTSNSGSTGGDIDTGLTTVNTMFLQPKGSSVASNAPVINETLPGADGTAITIVTDSDEVGNWQAWGR